MGLGNEPGSSEPAAGKADAEWLLADLEPGEEIPPEVYDLLMENNQDPDLTELTIDVGDILDISEMDENGPAEPACAEWGTCALL